MSDRRRFLKVALAAGTTGALTACSMTQEGAPPAESKASNLSNLPKGIIYTKENPGKWAKKVGGHAPNVTIDGSKVTVTTKHGMSKKHYIVRHTIVTEEGEVLADNTFSPSDDDPISIFEISVTGTRLYATSFCNKHDLWLTTFNV
jgi:superoxide reductase